MGAISFKIEKNAAAQGGRAGLLHTPHGDIRTPAFTPVGTKAKLPEELPKHFLGIGEPGDILDGIANGMDLFDCVAPTRIGRHGSIYTKRGIIHLTGEKFKNDFGPLDPEVRTSDVLTSGFTRAYVAHLIRAKEMLGAVICSMHNVGFILNLVADARQAILDDRFDDYRADFVRGYYDKS